MGVGPDSLGPPLAYVQQCSPKTELGMGVDRLIGPLTGPASLSFDLPNRHRPSGISQFLVITPSISER